MSRKGVDGTQVGEAVKAYSANDEIQETGDRLTRMQNASPLWLKSILSFRRRYAQGLIELMPVPSTPHTTLPAQAGCLSVLCALKA